MVDGDWQKLVMILFLEMYFEKKKGNFKYPHRKFDPCFAYEMHQAQISNI